MKHFTLAIVLLAVFASVALADRPSLKKKPVPVDPVPESVEEDDLEAPLPKKPISLSLKQKPEVGVAKVEKPVVNKKPVADVEDPVLEIVEESSDELSEEVVAKIPAKKPLLGGLRPKPSVAKLGVQPPENVGDSKQPIEGPIAPPTVGAKPKPALVNVKA